MYELLIVDDHKYQVESMSLSIPWMEYKIQYVHKAYSADEALDLIQMHSIDIVITDIRMPGMTGLELIEEIHRSWKHIKCIIMSGYDDFTYAKSALVNNAIDYLLKPVEEAELIKAVCKCIEVIESEWVEVISYQRTLSVLREHLPLLRADFLKDLLLGRRLELPLLMEKMALYEIEFAPKDLFTLLMIRMENHSNTKDYNSTLLFEYALCNIAEEILNSEFHLYYCKDDFDYIVIFVKCKNGLEFDRLEPAAKLIQHNVNKYLKGKISFLIGKPGNFPEDIREMYQSCLMAFRKFIGDDQELSIRLSEVAHTSSVSSLCIIRKFYEPTMFNHLFELGRWDDIRNNLMPIFEELQYCDIESSRELVMEFFFTLSSNFIHIAHKNGFGLSNFLGKECDKMIESSVFRSLQQFKEWTFNMINILEAEINNETNDTRTLVVRQVQEYIEHHLESDVSLQAIASYVHLNPTYLSKVYKLHTGEGLSDYIYRLRMERAAYRLQNSADKIYEISYQLGFQNPNYFIKIFKKHYNMTPQEYREVISKTSIDLHKSK